MSSHACASLVTPGHSSPALNLLVPIYIDWPLGELACEHIGEVDVDRSLSCPSTASSTTATLRASVADTTHSLPSKRKVLESVELFFEN